MSGDTTHLRRPDSERDRDAPKPEEVIRQLDRLLASPAFHGSKRCRQFLVYVCEKSLAGESGALKERTIAAEVFGRQPQSDLGEDTIVRVGAREVRKRLAQFYVSPEGEHSEIRIDLPSGTYVPEFHYAATVNPAPVPAKMRPTAQPRRLVALTAVVLVAIAVAMVLSLHRGSAVRSATGFERFWAPVFASPEPMILAVANPIVYHPSDRAIRLNEAALPEGHGPEQRAIQLPPHLLDGSDLIPIFNQYVGFGDMVVATEISTMFARRSRTVRLRMASGVELADLRNAPALLVGAITNRWTMEFQQNWRFRFGHTPDAATVIVDTATPGRQWSIPAREDGSAPEDYILICRLYNSMTGGLVMVAAGIKQFGTEAAGRELVDADRLSTVLRLLPAGWETRNLQVVLHARVINSAAGIPELVAWHVW